MSDLLRHVHQNIRIHGLIDRRQGVVIGVSGGPDSIVLLDVLHRLSQKQKWELVVAHFNHHLRGRSSQRDEAFVKEAARSRGLKFVSAGGDVRELARRRKWSVEMAARELRHEFLARSAKRLGIGRIALAHHADDQVELFFLRLLRGAGGEGLGGMDWAGPSPADASIRIVRPLLDIAKAGLAAYAAAQGLKFRIDGSNASLDHDRNRIRHELIPWLRTRYQPALTETALRLMQIVDAEADHAAQAASAWFKRKARPSFSKLHAAVQRQVLRQQLLRLGIAPRFALIELLREAPGRPVTVQPGLAVQRNAKGTVERVRARVSGFLDGELKADLTARKAAFAGRQFNWKLEHGSGAGQLPRRLQKNCEFFDADKIGSQIVLRHWRPGDRFQAIGLPEPVKLQDLFTNAKIPKERRHSLVLAATANGEVFWVEGLRIGEKAKLTPQTVRRLKWQWTLQPQVADHALQPGSPLKK